MQKIKPKQKEPSIFLITAELMACLNLLKLRIPSLVCTKDHMADFKATFIVLLKFLFWLFNSEHFSGREDKLYYREVIFGERPKKFMPASEKPDRLVLLLKKF